MFTLLALLAIQLDQTPPYQINDFRVNTVYGDDTILQCSFTVPADLDSRGILYYHLACRLGNDPCMWTDMIPVYPLSPIPGVSWPSKIGFTIPRLSITEWMTIGIRAEDASGNIGLPGNYVTVYPPGEIPIAIDSGPQFSCHMMAAGERDLVIIMALAILVLGIEPNFAKHGKNK